MTLLMILFSSFIIAFSGAMMPGPLLTVTISESSRRGFKAGPMLILGHGILEALLIVALLFGLASVLSKEWAFIVISFTGGIILLFMAIDMFRSLPKLSLSFEVDSARKQHLVLSGIMMSIINPYWIVWWATLGLGLILQSKTHGVPGVACFFTGHILGDLVWYSVIAFAVDRGRKLLTDKRYRTLIGLCAGFLLIFAGYFFVSAFKRL